MKKIFLLVVLFTSFLCKGQDFPVSWKSKFSFSPTRWDNSDDGKSVFGFSETQAELLDGTDGKSLWKINYKNDLKVKTLGHVTSNSSAGTITLYNGDSKKQGGEKIIIDYNTGKELWRTDGYAGVDGDDHYHFAHCMNLTIKGTTIVFDNVSKKMTGIDVRTGGKKWESKEYPGVDIKNLTIDKITGTDFAQAYVSDEDPMKDQAVYVNILSGETTDGSEFASRDGNFTSAFRVLISQTVNNTRVKLTARMKSLFSTKLIFELSGSGDVKWSKKFEGTAVIQAFNSFPYVQLDVQGDKIVVTSKNITVFDLKTGNQLWTAPYDNCDSGGLGKNKQEFGIAGWPLISGNYVYYVDLQIDNAIKKVELLTGKLVWKSEKIKSNDRVPNLNVVNGVLLAQFGGMINAQMAVYMNGGGYRKTNENKFDGDFGVRAYDVNTGALIWSTSKLSDKLGDKFSDRITTIYGMGNKVIVASDKNLFCLDAKTGNIVYKTSISQSKIGDVFEMLVSNDNKSLYILCDEGIAMADINSGKLTYATKTGEIFWKLPGTSSYSFSQGANYFVSIGEKEFMGFDLANGSIKGKMKNKLYPRFTTDGNYMFDLDDEKMTKYSVNNP